MKIEIKHRYENRILFEGEFGSLKIAVEAAVKSRADLRGADLSGAYLAGAHLSGADLAGADLAGAHLSGAYLRGAYLRGAYLAGADLAGADLSGAYLAGAHLSGADLRGADLRGADLSGAYLAGADLRGADLSGADLRGAKGVEKQPPQTIITPEGSIIGWKKCDNGVIVKLVIPENAKRSNAGGRKCRAEYATVLEVIGAKVGITTEHGPRTEYRALNTVKPDKWDPDWKNECSNGIHFFLTREEAEYF